MLILGLAGCLNFDSVDEACKDNVRGDKDASLEASEFYRRIGCYRRYTSQSQAKMNPRITEAVVAHAQYLELNGIDEFWQYEDGGAGFTGETAYERLDRSEYRDLEEGTAFVWEVLLFIDETVPRAQLVDEFMHDPFARDVFLAPAWEGGGYREGVDAVYGPFAYMNIVLYHPSGSRSFKPVTYPVDGQLSVPNTWAVGWDDPVLAGVPPIAGYPITFTVGSNDVGSGSNPLNLIVNQSTIMGPSGVVEHVVVGPGHYQWGTTWSTATLIPTAPLELGATYTADVELSWLGRAKRSETVTFTTSSSASAAPLARVARTHIR